MRTQLRLEGNHSFQTFGSPDLKKESLPHGNILRRTYRLVKKSVRPFYFRDALETVENAQGLTTPITIRKDHKVIRSAIIFRVDAEKFEAIDTYMVDYGD